MDINITEDRFEEIYKPQRNPFDPDGAPWDGCVLETYGQEFELVKAMQATDPGRVWTLLDCDGELVLSSGMHYVNRMGYLITEVPVADGDLVTVLNDAAPVCDGPGM
jgi:hypothetical protein